MNFKRTNHLIMALGVTLTAVLTPVLAQRDRNDPYQALVHREFGTAVKEMEAIDKQIQSAKPEEYPGLEARLIAVIETPGATMPGKQFACQMLRLIGSRQCVSAVAKLLLDEQLSHAARNVLLGLQDSAAGDALRDALGKTGGKVRIGIIHTLGDRHDHDSLPTLIALLTGNDEATSEAVLAAVAKIGGLEAADALDRAKLPDPLKPAWAQAYLRCAGSLKAPGETPRAQTMYRALFDGSYPSPVRAGAFREIVAVQQEQSVPMIVRTLDSDDPWLRRAALAAVIQVPGHRATAALARQLMAVAPETKPGLIGALAARGDPEGLIEMLSPLTQDTNTAIRGAAIKALGRVGNASTVPVLVAALNQSANSALARQALAELHGNGVAEQLIQQVQSGDPAVRANVLGVLGDRKQIEALPLARNLMSDSDTRLRQAAIRVLAELGTQEDLQRFCEAILTLKEDGDRDRFARTIQTIGSRLTDKAQRDDCVLQSFTKADPPTKVQLLGVLSAFGGGQALQATRRALAESGEVHNAAVRSLADWPDTAPVTDLRQLAREENDPVIRILALRGWIRMIGQSRGRTDQKVPAFREAMELCTRPDEKRLVLSELGRVSHAEALKLVEPCLGDDRLKREAWQAYERIGESLANSRPAVAKEALQKVLAETTDAGLRERARTALEKIK